MSSLYRVDPGLAPAKMAPHAPLGTDPDADGTLTSAQRIAYLEKALARQRELLAKNGKTLQAIYASHGWKVLSAYYRLRERMLPPDSYRRRAAKLLFRSAGWLVKRARRLLGVRTLHDVNDGYGRWSADNEPGPEELDKQRLTRFPTRPRISIIVPVYETPEPFLRAMIASVTVQTYADWELCLADGGSREPRVRDVLEEAAGLDPRVKVRFLPANEGIVGNSNAALALAGGDFVALLDHDDTLAPFALFEVVRAFNEHPEADFLYSDEDSITPDGGRRLDHHFKPDWSPDTLRSHNYVCHLSVFRRALLDKVGGFRPGFEGSQDYDLILRATEQARQIVHIPKVLYHWRIHDNSTTADPTTKMYAFESARKALTEHLARTGTDGLVLDGPKLGTYQVVYPLAKKPLVSILIPSRDEPETLAKCLKSVAGSSYAHHEILIIENHSRRPETFAYYKQLEAVSNVRILTWDKAFNYAAVNNFAAGHARGEVLLFLNNDVEVINRDWLERLLEHALRPAVGAVGAKLYYPDNTIQHAGVIVGIGGTAGHHHVFYPREAPGYRNRLLTVQNCSAVTGACLMMRRRVFDEVGGFDEGFILAFNDIDLCLKARDKGYAVIWTPFAELYHHESKTRGYEDTPQKQIRLAAETDLLQMKWGNFLLAGDPYYNPNLTLNSGDFGLRV